MIKSAKTKCYSNGVVSSMEVHDYSTIITITLDEEIILKIDLPIYLDAEECISEYVRKLSEQLEP